MIQYPLLNNGTTMGVTAPSSGVRADKHDILRQAVKRMEKDGFNVICGDTAWTQSKAKSSPAKMRADELNQMMIDDDKIGFIMPPWGGELLIEIIEHLNFSDFKCKWILGFSDISVLLLAVTLKTGIATAHGPSFVDLRGQIADPTTAMWRAVLATKTGESITQYSSEKYQQEWNNDPSATTVFNLTESTIWKTVNNQPIKIQGRLLGGCIDVIRHLIGTPYGDVQQFQNVHLNNEPILWYLENCELVTTDVRRSLVQMKLAGWFNHCSGIIFGRSEANAPIDNYTIEDVYKELYDELQVPIIYDVDCGHVPPQLTLINGAYAEVEVTDGKGIVKQIFKP